MSGADDAESAAQEYRLTLSELTSNNKTQINLLTILADDYKSFAPAIVDVIEKHTYSVIKVSRAQKLLVMYVCDSILKNVKAEAYNKLFARIIIRLFLHVFKEGDERTRSSMYKLRLTWTEIFLPAKLYQLDMKVNEEDRAWPIVNPQGGTAGATAATRQDRAAPRGNAPSAPTRIAAVAATTKTTVTSTSTATPETTSATAVTPTAGQKVVHVNRKFIQPQPNTNMNGNGKPAVTGRPLTSSAVLDTSKSASNESLTNDRNKKPIKREIKREPIDDVLDRIIGPAATQTTSKPKDVKVKDEPGTTTSKRKVADVSGPKSAPPRHEPPTAGFNKRRRSPLLEPPKDVDHRQPIIRPTQTLGAHAFANPSSMPPPMSSMPPPVLKPPMKTSSPPAQFMPMPPGYPPMGYPPSTSAMSQMPRMTMPPMTMPAVTSMPPIPPGLPYGMPPPGMPPLTLAPQQRVLPPPNMPKPVITDEAVKLDIPQNNRIFVDQKAYEVMFINETAVIERTGLPHRIYFAGPPRDVIIDRVPHMLSFGEIRQVMIDGYPHDMRFGAPSRELYMGDYPFKGQFGGPPIIATISGKRHEIRLTGAAPEVKIEPDPTYELIPALNKLRAEMKQPEKKEPAPATDPFSLLKKLQRKGYLKPATMPGRQDDDRKQNHQQQQRDDKKRGKSSVTAKPNSSSAASPSSTANDRVEIERKPTPPSTLKEFNIRQLKVRYDSVVEALLRKREDACQYCGMRMEGMPKGSKPWMDHMDEHIKRNLSRQKSTLVSPWYPSDLLWLKAKVVEKKTNETENNPDAATNRGVVADKSETKDCAICGEPFQVDYDDDEEEWRFRDSTVVQGKTVHTSCATDVTMTDDASSLADDELKYEHKPNDPFNMLTDTQKLLNSLKSL